MFREDDEGATPDVHTGFESRGVFQSARDRQADVYAVGHFVGSQGLRQGVDGLLSGEHSFVSKHLGTSEEPVQMGFEAKDLPLVKSESLPDGLAILDGGIEGADPGLLAVNELSVDENEEIFVLFRVGLEYRELQVE